MREYNVKLKANLYAGTIIWDVDVYANNKQQAYETAKETFDNWIGDMGGCDWGWYRNDAEVGDYRYIKQGEMK